MDPLLIRGMSGMGDCIYQLPVVKKLAEMGSPVYLKTPFPQFYVGIEGIKFIRPSTSLRTQSKNVSLFSNLYDDLPATYHYLHLSYVGFQKRGIPLYKGLAKCANLPESFYFLSIPFTTAKKNYAVIRPVTLRSEWPDYSRNPKAEYIQYAIRCLRTLGVQTVIVADVHSPMEVYDGNRPEADVCYDRGQILPNELLKMISEARVVVGGVGFIAPMAIATGTPAVIIHGGAGGLNGPEMIDAPGKGKLAHVLPERYCRCRNKNHNCDKTIDLCKLEQALKNAVKQSATSFPMIGDGATELDTFLPSAVK